MTAQNLAVCFAPTLFSLSNPLQKVSSGLVRRGSFKRNTLTHGLSPAQMAGNKEVNDSVVSMATDVGSYPRALSLCSTIFRAHPGLVPQAPEPYLERTIALPLGSNNHLFTGTK